MVDTVKIQSMGLGDDSGPDISTVSASKSISVHVEDKIEPGDEQLATLRRIADIPPLGV